MSHGNLTLAADILRNARHVVVFTGAGVSAESGIATFRDADGFWQRFPPEEFANWAGLLKTAAAEPRRFADFLLAVLEPVASAVPNAAHRAIADLERHVNVTVVTQNIDGLHRAAGNTVVKEIHGTLFELVSAATGRFVRLVDRSELREIVAAVRAARDSALVAARLPLAIQPIFGPGAGGFHRPNIVLFGDAMAQPAWNDALEAARACDVLLAVGTSGIVYPAATIPIEAKAHGAMLINIDPQEPGGDVWLRGTACEIVPELVRAALDRREG
jgi:NAD-dependent deacetylase